MKNYFLSALALIVITISSTSLSAQSTWQSNLVQIDTATGELSYTPDPLSGIKIPDFSRAGYKGGGVPLPTVPVKVTISPVSGDNTSHIQNAIDAVSAMSLDGNGFRGAVLLNPGEYRVFGTLKINTSGVVLRGSGRGSDSSTNTHILGLGNIPEDRNIIEMGGGSNTRFSGMVAGSQTNITTPIVEVGDKQFDVENASPFQVGDNIIINHPSTQAWINAIDGGGTDSDPSWTVNSQDIIYNTRIERIDGNTIHTNSPIFNTLNASLSQSFIYKYDRAGLVENVGIENLLVDIEFNSNDPDDDNHAQNAVLIIQAENAWVKGAEFRHFWYAGVDMETANYVTVEDCNAFTPKGPTTGGLKYNFCVSDATQNTLFTNCRATEARHAYVSNGTSSVAGVVFHRCISTDPFNASEGHRRWTTGLLYDNFIDNGNLPNNDEALGLYNRGRFGTGHGWSSVNSVVWNCDVSRPGADGRIIIQRPPTAQNFAIGCKGTVTGDGFFTQPSGYIEGSNRTDLLLPNSLYEAQLVDRNLNGNPNAPVCSTPISSFPYSESFESGFGDWEQATGDDFDWTRISGSTPSNDTGPPSADDGSFYLFTEASFKNNPLKSVLLNSPCFDLTGQSNASLSFSYHMSGVGMGTLDLDVSDDNGATWTTEFTESGDQGSRWLTTTVDLSSYTGNVIQIRFTGETGPAFTSDMAIDDISIISTSTPPPTDCDDTITTFPYSESFESGFGDWQQAADDDFDWTRISGSTPSNNTGPTSADDGSFYLFTEASFKNSPTKLVILNSPCFDLSGQNNASLSFSYHMYGEAIGLLDLEVSDNGGASWNTEFIKIWRSRRGLVNSYYRS